MTQLAIHRTGSGPDLVMLHGWGMHSGVFESLLPRLSGHLTVHRVDLPGHGASVGYRQMPNLAELADRLAEELPAASWLGWSLGGMVAMMLAARHPQRVDRLVLTATTPRWTASADWPHGMPRQTFEDFYRDLRDQHEATWQRFLSLEVHGSDNAGRDLRQLRAIAAQHPPPSDEVLDSGLQILADADLRPRLAELTMPALLICGQRDRLVTPAAMGWLAQALPDAVLNTIEGAGHAPFLGQPDLFCNLLLKFATVADRV